ncbi:MAG: hypothetical protein KF795_23465 [Labilithrix sp.]|nr:hypothetical protein [Labilithrix sp.]
MASNRSEMSVGRKVLAGAAMVGAAAAIVPHAFHRYYPTEWLLVTFAGVLALAGVGLTRTSLAAQVLSRGAAWVMLAPAAMATAASAVGRGSFNVEAAGFTAALGAALLLARPLLHTARAKEEFAPKVFRRWFLGGSTATAAAGIVASGVALATISNGSYSVGASFGALALSLFASAIAVVRMRAWGVLLGAVTSIALVVSGLFLGRSEAMALALFAAPALLMHTLPVLVARWRSPDASSRTRIADESALSSAYAPAHVRVAVDDVDELGEPAAAGPRAHAAIPS